MAPEQLVENVDDNNAENSVAQEAAKRKRR